MKKVMLFVIIMGIGLFIIGSWLFTNTYGASSPNQWTLGGFVKFIFEDTPQLPPPDQNQYTQHGIGLHFEERTPPSISGPAQYFTHLPFDPTVKQTYITATISLKSQLPHPETYAMIALVDYNQTPLTIKGKTQSVYPIKAAPMSTIDIDFSVAIPNQVGQHKLWLYFFQASEIHHLDQDFRMSTADMFTSFDWDVVIGDKFDVPSTMDDPLIPKIQHLPTQIEEFGAVLINRQTQDNAQGWFTETVTLGQSLDYSIHLGNYQHPRTPYALVAFLDWQQISLTPKGDKVIWGTIEAGDYLTIPTQLQVPTIGNIHELQVLYITDPYAPRSPITSTDTLTMSSTVLPSVRVGLSAK